MTEKYGERDEQVEMSTRFLCGKNIIKKFGDTEALHGIDVDIKEGSFTVVMGSSGSGKSTLLYLLSGMDKPSGGEIFYQETKISGATEKELTHLRASQFGFVFQRTHLIGNLTVSENIKMAGLIGGLAEKECELRTAELIRKMNLEKVEAHLPSEVSGGEAQRTAVARAVINRPALIFADEPTGALNRANSTEVLNLLTMLNKNGQTVLLVTHDRESALRGNRILYLDDGRMTGELSLSDYDGRDAEREEKLTGWLEGLGW